MLSLDWRELRRRCALSHAGLAIGGLTWWLSYLVSGQPAFAWLALCVLLPVAGLGIATLIQAISDPTTTPTPRLARR